MDIIEQRIAVKVLMVDDHGQVLLLRKSVDDDRHAGNSGRYNLPGGKVKPGETVEQALSRELAEEAGVTLLDIDRRPLFVGEWRPYVQDIPTQIIGLFFVCRSWRGAIKLDSEHDQFVWVNQSSAHNYDILPPEDKALKAFFIVIE